MSIINISYTSFVITIVFSSAGGAFLFKLIEILIKQKAGDISWKWRLKHKDKRNLANEITKIIADPKAFTGNNTSDTLNKLSILETQLKTVGEEKISDMLEKYTYNHMLLVMDEVLQSISPTKRGEDDILIGKKELKKQKDDLIKEIMKLKK